MHADRVLSRRTARDDRRPEAQQTFELSREWFHSALACFDVTVQRLQNAERDRLRDGADLRGHVRQTGFSFTGSVLVTEDLFHRKAAFRGDLIWAQLLDQLVVLFGFGNVNGHYITHTRRGNNPRSSRLPDPATAGENTKQAAKEKRMRPFLLQPLIPARSTSPSK
jgi:hypothetical protein